MKFWRKKLILGTALTLCFTVPSVSAQTGRLSPQNFNAMYYLATKGKVGVLREAVHRGLNIDAMNPNGDTGLCIAIKHKDHIAYNSFRMSGANARHACTYRIYKEYQDILNEGNAVSPDKVAGNKESLYYTKDETSWWPWILGAGALGAGIWALSSSGGSGGSDSTPATDDTIIPTTPGKGLASVVLDYYKAYDSGSWGNNLQINASNPDAEEVVSKIQFLPNMLDNKDYLQSYFDISGGAYFENMLGGGIILGDSTLDFTGDGAIGIAVHEEGSKGVNNGTIKMEASNGAIGMVASNGGQVLNSPDYGTGTNGNENGTINIIFTGTEEGNTVIGMMADTNSTAINHGNITGTTALISSRQNGTSSTVSDILSDLTGDSDEDDDDEEDDEENSSTTAAANSGTILGMALFDYYTGTNYSNNTVTADNYGTIFLTAGYNSATDVAVSLIGMGSYIDDKFLNGNNNPAFAEKMKLNNYGNITLGYEGTYSLSDTALKLGDGGLIGMRADAATTATNQGTIDINLTSTEKSSGVDVAAAMLSVHGGELVNGKTDSVYNGTQDETGGTIQIVNEATLGGVSYGMLAAKGDGSQTRLYKWQSAKLTNNGLIDVQASNAYAMASFAGGEVINNGVINLGVENGNSYYSNNYGIYAGGGSDTDLVSLTNTGIINVNSQESTAIYNAFSGSVSALNTGTIYISNKATGSEAFGGNFSKAVNSGKIIYKVDNSENFTMPTSTPVNLEAQLVAAVMSASVDSDATKQLIVNETGGVITLGEAKQDSVDYGGTYGTAAMKVSQQGAAVNNGTITLVSYLANRGVYNAAMAIDSSARAAAYAYNYGDIYVNAVNSIGMRNESAEGAQMTNYGNIYVNGINSYGMAVTEENVSVYNGQVDGKSYPQTIYVNGQGSVGMYIKDGIGYNYGTIKLTGTGTTAFVLDGDTASFGGSGTITYASGLDDLVFYAVTNGATRKFDDTDGLIVNGYTLGKAYTDSSGGTVALSQGSSAYVSGSNSHLFAVEGSGSTATVSGYVEASGSATAVTVEDQGTVTLSSGARAVVKDEGSQFASVESATLNTKALSQLDVEDGVGIYATISSKVDADAVVSTAGKINVTQGTGVYLVGGDPDTYGTKGTNSGTITALGSTARGVDVRDGATFTNSGTVSAYTDGASSGLSTYAYGIYTDSTVTNEGTVTVGKNGVGIYGVGGTITNSGTITVNDSSAYGIYNLGANVVNSGNIVVNNGVGVNGNVENQGTITVASSAGTGAYGSIVNSGTIEVDGGVGVNGSVTNTGKITVNGGKGISGAGKNSGTIEITGGTGAYVTGSFINTADGTISGSGTAGVEVGNGGEFTNAGEINMTSGRGIYVGSYGSAINTGTITMSAGTGMYIASNGKGENTNAIVLAGEGYGAYVEDGGTFVNSGEITYDSSKSGKCSNNTSLGGTCTDTASDVSTDTSSDSSTEIATTALEELIYVGENANFINTGLVEAKAVDIDFDALKAESGSFVVGEGGTYKAASLSGNVVAGKDLVTGGFEDTYIAKDAFVGENKGLNVTSQSYLFEADVKDKGESSDIELTRKDFNDVLDDEEKANFFETNYQLNNHERMYNALKEAETKAELDEIAQSETGEKFYANLPRENMAVLRSLNTMEQNRILNDGIQTGVGADYYRTGKDANGNLSGYSDDIYSAYMGYGSRLNRNWSVGANLRAAYVDADYDEANSSRNNKILMAFLPLMYQNGGFKFLTTPELGMGFGTYKRQAASGRYEADTTDFYYGLYNYAEYSIDAKVAELVTSAELNVQGSSMSKAKEDDGLNLNANDSLSVEGGVGVKLRKKIALAKDKALILAVGTKYYHEFADPYKRLTIGMNGSPVDLHQEGYDEGKDRLRTAAEAIYKDGDLSIAAEVAHNAEKESNIEGGLGFRYHF